jgi:hypothetical protein
VGVQWLQRDDADSERLTFEAWVDAEEGRQYLVNSTEIRAIGFTLQEVGAGSIRVHRKGEGTRSARQHSKAVVVDTQRLPLVQYKLPVEVENSILHRCW